MKPRTLALTALLVLAVGSVTLLAIWGGGEGRPDDPGGNGQAAPGPGEPERPVTLPGEPGNGGREPAVPSSGPGEPAPAELASRLVVSVTREPFGVPADDVEIDVGRRSRSSSGIDQSGRSERTGTASFEIPAGASPHFVDVRDARSGFVERQWIREEIGAGETLSVHFSIPPEVTLSGTCRGEGVGSTAEVRVWTSDPMSMEGVRPPDRTAPCDPTGRFEVAVASRKAYLSAVSENGASARGLIVDAAGTDRIEGLELVLEPTRRVRGRVLGPDENPVPSCRVRFGIDAIGVAQEFETSNPRVSEYLCFGTSATTGNLGEWNARLPSSRIMTKAEEPGFLPFAEYVQYDPDGEAVIRLDRGWTLTGVVLDRARRPVAGATVVAGGGRNLTRKAVSGEDGRFSLEALYEDDLRESAPDQPGEGHSFVGAWAPGFAPTVLSPIPEEWFASDSAARELVLVDAGSRLAGRVVDADDRPVIGAKVTLHGGAEFTLYGFATRMSPEKVFDRHETRTGLGGEFVFDDLLPGEYSIEVRVRGVSPPVRVPAELGKELLVRIPGDLARVSLRAVAGPTGAPIARFEALPIRVQGERVSGGRLRSSGADGSVVLSGLRPGEYGFELRAAGFATTTLPTRQLEATSYELEAELWPRACAELDVPAEPDALFVLRFLDENDETLPFEVDGTTWRSYIAHRSVRACGLPATRVVLESTRISLDGAEEPVIRNLDLSDGGSRVVDLTGN